MDRVMALLRFLSPSRASWMCTFQTRLDVLSYGGDSVAEADEFHFAEKLLTHGCKEIWGTEVDM